MPLEIKFEIEGETQLSRRFGAISDKVNDFKPTFEKTGIFLKDFFGGEVFTTEGRAIGEPWVKRKKAYPWPPLQRSGRMRKSFVHQAEAKKVSVWNTTDYFKYHQSRMPHRIIPRRVMMKITEQLKDKIVKFFHETIIKAIKETR